VVTEKQELGEKLDKLKAFIEESPTFKKLPFEEQSRLNRQFDAMAIYSQILGERINAFDNDPLGDSDDNPPPPPPKR
jgi:hypothetical protein